MSWFVSLIVEHSWFRLYSSSTDLYIEYETMVKYPTKPWNIFNKKKTNKFTHLPIFFFLFGYKSDKYTYMKRRRQQSTRLKVLPRHVR